MTVSAARTIVLDETLTLAPPGRYASPVPLAWPNKDPGDVLDYSLDVTAFLADVADTISTVTATATPSDLIVSNVGTASGVLTCWLSGGTAGTSYIVHMVAVTAAGRTLSRTVALYVATISSSSE